MTLLILLLLILTFGPRLDEVGAPAVLRAWQHMKRGANGAAMQRGQNAALGLIAVTFLAAHVAHEARAPQAALASAQDEISWVARHDVAQLPQVVAAARFDISSLREGE